MSNRRLTHLAQLSILAAVVTLGLKAAGWALTGSVSLLSDAAESLVNLAASATALVALVYAARPVDRNHTYGHEKIEFFSSGAEGALILAAAASIAVYAVYRLFVAEPLQTLGWGMAFIVAASAINGVVAQILLRAARKHRSIVLEADGKHLMSDVWTSLGILAGLGLVWVTRLEVLDPIVALIVAGSLLWTAFGLVRRSFNGLMDHALPDVEQQAVRRAIEGSLRPDRDYHAVRTRQAGSRRFVDFHLLVPGSMTVQEAHDLTGGVEDAVRAALPGIEVTVHIEPIEEKAAYEDSDLVPLEEADRHKAGPDRPPAG
jgi:cation diffusion facilitator family transporter